MADPLAFIEESSVHYGAVSTVSALVRRIVARNPGPFTYTGTGTYIIGHGTVAILDPGPELPEHIEAVLAAVAGEKVSHLVITHTHRDHSPAARALKVATGAIIAGCKPLGDPDKGKPAEEAFDPDYMPDQILEDGDRIEGPGWTLGAVFTPGHTSNHLCYGLQQEKALFTGDHVMGWSTSVVAPPDGDMAAYVASLKKLLDRDDKVYYPTHGGAVMRPKAFVRGLINHRRMRESQILRLLEEGPSTITALVERMYMTTPKVLHAAAGRSVLAHLIDMRARGLVQHRDDRYSLAVS